MRVLDDKHLRLIGRPGHARGRWPKSSPYNCTWRRGHPDGAYTACTQPTQQEIRMSLAQQKATPNPRLRTYFSLLSIRSTPFTKALNRKRALRPRKWVCKIVAALVCCCEKPLHKRISDKKRTQVNISRVHKNIAVMQTKMRS